MMIFSLTSLPAIHFGSGARHELPKLLSTLETMNVLLVTDPFWINSETVNELRNSLVDANIATLTYSDFQGEAKAKNIDQAREIIKNSDVKAIIGLGGGTALDSAKMIAALGHDPHPAQYYALGARPIPSGGLPAILIPTTAGTGSEANGTAIFSDEDGHKLWAFGPNLKAKAVILDPDLTVSLPASISATTGLDAFIHAFEAASNRWSQPLSLAVSLRALARIGKNIIPAVQDPSQVAARGEMLLGAFEAGHAIENCGTAIAHNLSHALSGLAPVQHGLATALAFELTLPFIVSERSPELEAIAKALNLNKPSDLPQYFTKLINKLKIERSLPKDFTPDRIEELMTLINDKANAPMLNATRPTPSYEQMKNFAQQLLSLHRR